MSPFRIACLPIATAMFVLPLRGNSPLEVSAGNAAGESASILAVSQFYVPPVVPSVSGERMDKDTVKIEWSLASIPPELLSEITYVIFRVDNNNPTWTEIAARAATPIAMGIAEPWHPDTGAPAVSRYRYVVCTRRTYTEPADGEITVHSPPSSEAVVEYAAADIRAGGQMYYDLSDMIPPPDGFFLLEKFILEGDVAGYPPSVPTNPQGVSGTLNEIEFGEFGHLRYDEARGYLPMGVTLQASAHVWTSDESIGEYPLIDFETIVPWTGFVPPPTYSEDGHILDMQSTFGLFTCDYEGGRILGFDSVTNPKTQMLHVNEPGIGVSFKVKPDAPQVVGLAFPIQHDPQVIVEPESVPQGETNVTLTALAPQESDITLQDLAPVLRVQALARETIRVAIVPLITRENGIPIAEASLLADPGIANIQFRMDQTFLKNANVKVECFGLPADYMDDDDDDGGPGGSDGGALNIDTILDFNRISNRADAIKLSANPAYDFVIFWVHNPGPNRGGQAHISSGVIVVSNLVAGGPSPNACAHELGHALGLHHPWQGGTSYEQTVTPDSPTIRVMGYGGNGFYFLPAERAVIHQKIRDMRNPNP